MRSSNVAPVCLVNPDSANVTPYLSNYLDCLSTPADFVFWDRRGDDSDDVDGFTHTYRYVHRLPDAGSRGFYPKLLTGYLGFRRFAADLLVRNGYQKVVLLTGNCATILSGTLAKHYRGRYVMDVRDFFLENLGPYRRMEQRALQNAGLRVISSPAYETFLGYYSYLVMHNDQSIDLEPIRASYRGYHPGDVCTLASIGTAKNLELDRRVIEFFGNDERFRLKFVGRGYDQLAPFVRDRGYPNIEVRGAFDANQTAELYSDVDVIMNLYGNHHPHFDYALSNKLYFAARLQRPLLVCADTYMEKIATANDLGMALRLEDASERDAVLALLDTPAAERRIAGAESFVRRVTRENAVTLQTIKEFLAQGGQEEC